MPEMPPFEFDKLLAHTFPGFLLAFAIFMMIDILSPIDLINRFSSIEGLIAFIGMILIIGTILGVVIDHIHHIITEPFIFSRFKRYADLRSCMNKINPDCCNHMNAWVSCIFKKRGKEAITTLKYLGSDYYHYSEFFANSFISFLILGLIMTV